MMSDIKTVVKDILEGASVREVLSESSEGNSEFWEVFAGVAKSKSPEELGHLIEKELAVKVKYLGLDMATWNDIFTVVYPDLADQFEEPDDYVANAWDDFVEDFYTCIILKLKAGEVLYASNPYYAKDPFGVDIKVVSSEVSQAKLLKFLIKNGEVNLVIAQDDVIYVVCSYD